MINLQQRNGQYTFAMNGGGTKTTKWAFVLPILLLTALIVIYDLGLNQYVGEAVQDIVGLLLIGVALVLFIVSIRALTKGKFSRFEIRLTPQKGTICAYDRNSKQLMWEDHFRPNWLYIANAQIFVRGECYIYPALVYGCHQVDIVEESIPSPQHALLGYGEQEVVQLMIHRLMVLAKNHHSTSRKDG